jgi:hypothetical protein
VVLLFKKSAVFWKTDTNREVTVLNRKFVVSSIGSDGIDGLRKKIKSNA